MRRRRGDGSQVYAITSAPRALGEDVHARTVRYLISMGIRTGCLLLLLVVPGPWKWVCAAGAVLLPLFAVVLANAGRERPEKSGALVETPPLAPDHQLPPAAGRPLPYDPKTEYLR